jgi:hypothetical protein
LALEAEAPLSAVVAAIVLAGVIVELIKLTNREPPPPPLPQIKNIIIYKIYPVPGGDAPLKPPTDKVTRKEPPIETPASPVPDGDAPSPTDRVTIGVADDSGWLGHRVKFEIIGDDKGYLDDPVTLRFGETRDLKVNVRDISRLKLKITELSSGASDSPSKPVWANPIVVPFRSHTARATRP